MREGRTTSDTATWKRVAKTAAGGTLVAWGLRRRTVPGYIAALTGGVLAYRGLRGADVEIHLENLEAQAQAVDVERSLTIAAPADDVRTFLSDPDRLDEALDEVGTVEALSEARQRWTLHSPTGHALSWDMRREDMGTEDEMEWTSTGDLDVGITLALEPTDEDTTVTTMTLTVEPPGGSIGQALTERLDIVPQALVAGFLQRTKTLLEGEHRRSEGALGAGSPATGPGPGSTH
jgi:uncharacterized membrane protein